MEHRDGFSDPLPYQYRLLPSPDCTDIERYRRHILTVWSEYDRCKTPKPQGFGVFLALAWMLLYAWHENEHEQHDETMFWATTLDGGSSLLSLGRESIAARHEGVRFRQRRTSVV